MRIGIPQEIKTHEYRVAATPDTVREFTRHGHTVLVQAGAGTGAGFPDAAYAAAGARLVDSGHAVYTGADLVLKVKEPQPHECAWLRADQAIFTYLHLAADPVQARALVDSGTTAIAYETVTDAAGGLPLLAPMSEVAGRMAVQAGAHALERPQGGAGLLLGGVPGVPAAHVLVLGAGVVGTQAAAMAVGLGAQVTVVNRSAPALRRLDERFGNRVRTQLATTAALQALVRDADLVIGAALVPGAAAPRLVPRAWLAGMRSGSVLVDVSIDQGGCFETSRPTTHAQPTYVVDGVVHYAVANMPGAVPRTSTLALTAATLPFVLALADRGWDEALAADPHLARGLNVRAGRITHAAVAQALGLAPRDATGA